MAYQVVLYGEYGCCPCIVSGKYWRVFEVVRFPSESQQPKGYWHSIIGGPSLAVLQASFMSVLAGVELKFPVTFCLMPEKSGSAPTVVGDVMKMEWVDARRVNLTIQQGAYVYQVRDYNHEAHKGDLGVMDLEGFVPEAKRHPAQFEVDPDIRRALYRLRMMAGVAMATGQINNLSDLYADAKQVLNETKPLAELLHITT